MKEQNTSKVYAKTFALLGEEHGVDFAEELTKLTEAINLSNDLENVLFLDVFTDDEKKDVFEAIAKKIKLNDVANHAIKYLIEEKRISLLPLIFKEIIVLDDEKRGFLRGVIEGTKDEISDSQIKILRDAIKDKFENKEIKLNYKKNKDITSGFKITVGDYQLDATVDRQLQNLKQTIIN